MSTLSFKYCGEHFLSLSSEYLEDGYNFYFCYYVGFCGFFQPDFLGQGRDEIWHRDGRLIVILLLWHAGLLYWL